MTRRLIEETEERCPHCIRGRLPPADCACPDCRGTGFVVTKRVYRDVEEPIEDAYASSFKRKKVGEEPLDDPATQPPTANLRDDAYWTLSKARNALLWCRTQNITPEEWLRSGGPQDALDAVMAALDKYGDWPDKTTPDKTHVEEPTDDPDALRVRGKIRGKWETMFAIVDADFVREWASAIGLEPDRLLAGETVPLRSPAADAAPEPVEQAKAKCDRMLMAVMP